MPHAHLVNPSPSEDTLPAYASQLDAFHRAFRPELEALIQELPLTPAARVLDVPCGDGFFAGLLRARLGREGAVTLADCSPAYLAQARETLADAAPQADTVLVEADAYALPFPDGVFDLVWCAQSLISLDDPVAAVREMGRVVRPGGCVALLENDAFHDVLLPWPVDLEAALTQAILRGSQRRYGRPGKLHAGRRLGHILTEAGLHPQCRKTVSADRLAPLAEAETAFLRSHLAALRELAAPHLEAPLRDRFDRLTSADDPQSLLRRADLGFTCLNTLVFGSH